ncbi:hypothetical protein [Nocardioides sp.]|uniref:hypothetical protein n=1 Tax=Nocardioides sp. TaxID=35761 RepID=UPI003D0B267A
MPNDVTALLNRLVGGDPRAAGEVLVLARTSDSAPVLVAAAMLQHDTDHLTHAARCATSPRERQLVVLAEAHLQGNTDLLDVLVRDHLADHPDHLLAAWIAGQRLSDSPKKENPVTQLSPPPTTTTTRSTTVRTIARWMVSFVGFPLGGLSAMILVGPVDTTPGAIAGGLLTGTVLGSFQAWAMRSDRFVGWVVATAIGLAVGLGIGATLVDFNTGLGDLVTQGAITGLTVGIAQSLVLLRRTGALAFAWPVHLAAVWALGWAITTSVGVQVEDQFTVFGAAGAVTATLLTAVLPVLLSTRFATTEKSTS